MSRDELVSGPVEQRPGRRSLPSWLGWLGLVAAGFVAVQLAGTGVPPPPSPPSPSPHPPVRVTELPPAPLNLLARSDNEEGLEVTMPLVDPHGRPAVLLIECIGAGVVQVSAPEGRPIAGVCEPGELNTYRHDLYSALGLSSAADAPDALKVETTLRPPDGRWRVSVQLPLTLP